MPNTVFFAAPGTLSRHRLHDRPSVQLQLGITAFEAGLAAKQTSEISRKANIGNWKNRRVCQRSWQISYGRSGKDKGKYKRTPVNP